MIKTRNARQSTVLAVLAAAMLVLTACGGGEPEDEDVSVTEPTTDADDASPDAGGDGSAALTDADCRQYAEAFQNIPDATDPDSIDSIGDLADILDEAADEVPDEISDDFRVIADAYRSFSDAMGDLDFDITDPESMAAMGPEDIAALEEAGQAFDSEEIETAGQNIDAFLRENCT